MSHGVGAFPLIYASTAEALAAAGYLVVGVFGHSFGGSHSFRAAATLPAVAAAANGDETVFSEDFARGVAKPYLTIAGRDGDPTEAELQAQVNQLRALGLSPQDAATVVGRGLPRAAYEATRPAYLARIPAARHQNFSDFPAISLATGLPVDASQVNMADAREIGALQDGLLIRFFNGHLRGRSESIALPPTRLSGVTLEARP